MLSVDFFSRPSFPSPPLMRRSPLGARDTNTCSWSPSSPPMSSGSSSEKKPAPAPAVRPRNLEPRKRESKYAPLMRRKDDRELRRNAFLNRGREASEDKRFEARAEQNMRLEWLEEQRRWEARKKAEDEAPREGELDMDVESAPEQAYTDAMDQTGDVLPPPSDDDEAFEYYMLSQQEEEMDMGLPDLSQPHLSAPTNTQPMEFWSDDDEFEKSLLQAAMEAERAPDWSDQAIGASKGDDTEMMVD